MKPEITSTITLKIRGTTLTLTHDEAREVHRQLGNLLPDDFSEQLKAYRHLRDTLEKDKPLPVFVPVMHPPSHPVIPWSVGNPFPGDSPVIWGISQKYE